MEQRDRRTKQFTIRVTNELHEKLKLLAERDKRQLATYVHILLEEHADAKLAEKREAVE